MFLIKKKIKLKIQNLVKHYKKLPKGFVVSNLIVLLFFLKILINVISSGINIIVKPELPELDENLTFNEESIREVDNFTSTNRKLISVSGSDSQVEVGDDPIIVDINKIVDESSTCLIDSDNITVFINNKLNNLKNKYKVSNYSALYTDNSIDDLDSVCREIADVFVKTRVVNYNYIFARKFFDIEKIRIALLEGMKYRIPPSVKLAQCYIESHNPYNGDINSLAKNNNFFGIKAKSTDENKMYKLTTEYVSKKQKKQFEGRIFEETYMGNDLYKLKVKDYFKVDNSMWESFRDHSNKMVKHKRYHSLFVHSSDYKKWCEQLQKSNYATSKTYGETIKKLIEMFYLYELDHN